MQIEIHSNTFPVVYKGMRKFVIKRFPFIIYYRLNKNNEVEII